MQELSFFPAFCLVGKEQSSSSSALEMDWIGDSCTQLIPEPAHHLGNTYMLVLMLLALADVAKYFSSSCLCSCLQLLLKVCSVDVLLLPGLNAKRSKHLGLLIFSPFTPVKHLGFWSLSDTSGLQGSVRWRHCSALWVCPSLAEELPSSLGRAVCCGYHRGSTLFNS